MINKTLQYTRKQLSYFLCLRSISILNLWKIWKSTDRKIIHRLLSTWNFGKNEMLWTCTYTSINIRHRNTMKTFWIHGVTLHGAVLHLWKLLTTYFFLLKNYPMSTFITRVNVHNVRLLCTCVAIYLQLEANAGGASVTGSSKVRETYISLWWKLVFLLQGKFSWKFAQYRPHPPPQHVYSERLMSLAYAGFVVMMWK